jgi:acetylornithine deacetylase/succinyl-diaminopimelate desuccinylase-like protein
MATTVEGHFERHTDDARALLERLCRQPSIAAQGRGIVEMADLVESLLGETGFATRQLTIPGAPPIVYGELRGRGSYTLLLYDHYDVQPPEPLDLWESPPFEPTVRDGKLYARGTSDDKGEIAARLTAIAALRAAHGELPITLRWVIEGEEEVGSPHFGPIIEPHADLLRADGCLWEGTGFEPSGRPNIMLGAKGMLYIQLDVRALARDAHSGTATILPSAAWRLVQALATLRGPDGQVRISGFYDALRAPSAEEVAALGGAEDVEAEMKATYAIERFVDGLSGLDLRTRAAFTPTCNIAGLTSGYGGPGLKTVLPAEASAKIDFRLVPDQDPEDILAKLRRHLDDHGYQDVRVTALGMAEPVLTPVDDPFARRAIAVAERFAGKSASITPLGGGSLPLLGPLRRIVGVPGLSVPGDPVYWANGAHSPNEHIRLADLDLAVRFNCALFAAIGGEHQGVGKGAGRHDGAHAGTAQSSRRARGPKHPGG